MNETEGILVDTAERLFSELATARAISRAERCGLLEQSWQEVEAMGLPLALVPEDKGGFGVDPSAALALVRLAGQFALPLPLAETMMANRLLAVAELPLPGGALSLGRCDETVSLMRQGDGWRLAGSLKRVAWGGSSAGIALVVGDERGLPHVVLLPAGQFTVTSGRNLANEPRDDLTFDTTLPSDMVSPAPGLALDTVLLAGAALRAIQLAGAIGRVLDMTIQYANDRVQFGRPIGKFQATQQSLAVLAGQSAVATGGAYLAVDAVVGGFDVLTIAVAKARTSEAAGVAAAIAHQIHGAIGFTHEHTLHHITRRLWSWRDEFGNESHWNRCVGAMVLQTGADGLWPLMTAA